MFCDYSSSLYSIRKYEVKCHQPIPHEMLQNHVSTFNLTIACCVDQYFSITTTLVICQQMKYDRIVIQLKLKMNRGALASPLFRNMSRLRIPVADNNSRFIRSRCGVHRFDTVINWESERRRAELRFSALAGLPWPSLSHHTPQTTRWYANDQHILHTMASCGGQRHTPIRRYLFNAVFFILVFSSFAFAIYCRFRSISLVRNICLREFITYCEQK